MPKIHSDSKLEHSANPSKAIGGKAAPKRKSRRRAKDPTAGLPVLNPNAAAIDIGAAEHWVAVPPGRDKENSRRFGCFTADLKALVAWLKKCGVTTVVLEATGNYWIVLYDLLEAEGLNPVVVNPRYAKNMTGKKSDMSDCEWMQKLHTYGLFANSFRPGEEIRPWRTYLRQRETLVIAASQAIQHMHKALVEMNVQLARVLSDISGETGLRIIDAILGGERDAQTLARLKDARVHASQREIALALQGHWKEDQLFVLEQARLSLAHCQEQIDQCEQRMQQQMRSLKSRYPQEEPPPSEAAASAQQPATPFDLSGELKRIAGVDLTRIDGVGSLTAQIVLSEIGPDVSKWATEKRFASWLGLCPDHKISGGKILSRSTRRVVNRARNALRMAAYSLERSQSALGAKYRRLKGKLGAPKAIIAMAHHLARLIWRMLRYGAEYVDKGMAAYETKCRAQRMKRLEKQARELNMKLIAA
jgi:transposase